MEIDSIKMAKKLEPYCKTVLIAKKDHFIANEMKASQTTQLETIAFKSNLGFSLIYNLRRIIQKHNIKNVIFFGASELKSMYFAFLGLDINLIIRHGTTKSRPKKDWFHRLIYLNVNYHVAICEHLAKNVKYIIPFGKNTQLVTIYSSLPKIDLVQKKTHSHNPIKLLHIGRIANAKGQKDAILACQILVDNNIDFELNLVGGFHEPYKEEFLNFLEHCSYKDKITLVGHTDKVSDFLNESDIFIFPSHGEGLSNAFLEALAHNLICISYNNTSFPELEALGFYFHMVENKNIQKLQSALLAICKEPKHEFTLHQNNNNQVTTIFSLSNEMENYQKILR